MVARPFACLIGVLSLITGISSAVDADIGLLNIRFYGAGPGEGHVYINDKKVFVRDWERYEFHEYQPLDARPAVLNVVVSVLNSGDATEEAEIRMAVSPKLAPIVYIPGLVGSGTDPSTADVDATQLGAVWFAPTRLVSKRVKFPAKRPEDVSFERISLADLLTHYAKQHLWPVELRIDVSVEPTRTDRRLANNTLSRSLRINLPPY